MTSKADKELVQQQLDAIRTMAQTMTDVAARLAGQTINDVLEVATKTFPTVGDPRIELQWHVAAGAIEVSNMGIAGHIVTVTSGSPGGSAPDGTGSYKIDGGTVRTVPLASRTATIWGTAGDRVSYAVYTRGPQPVT